MQETRLAWLAGIFDGEGCLTIIRRTVKHRSGNTAKVPMAQMNITNTSKLMIEECESILEELGVKYSIVGPYNYAGVKFQKRIHISRIDGLKILLDAITPYMVAKKQQAIVMKEFLETVAGIKGNHEERFLYYDQMHALNHHESY